MTEHRRLLSQPKPEHVGTKVQVVRLNGTRPVVEVLQVFLGSAAYAPAWLVTNGQESWWTGRVYGASS